MVVFVFTTQRTPRKPGDQMITCLQGWGVFPMFICARRHVSSSDVVALLEKIGPAS